MRKRACRRVPQRRCAFAFEMRCGFECARLHRIPCAVVGLLHSHPAMSNTPEYDRWFHEEVEIHHEALRAWLRGKFPAVTDVDNLIQETMARVWRARSASDVSSPRALLFTTARNLAIDQLRRQNIIPMEPITETAELPVYEESLTPAEASARNQELELLTQAILSLPEKCRQVLT